ncbi:Glycosyltransferase 1 domain-containing protein 1 [Taenia solium]|eukprot:TsM_001128800 transcript=TsM_001128800 gene=TsM_001128800
MTAAMGLINSSFSEGQPLSIMETMALGCPVVARNIPANTDLIHHSETGLMFSSPDEVKDCLESLLVNEDLHRSISARAVEKMRQHEFQLHTEAAAYLKLVNDIQMMESNH